MYTEIQDELKYTKDKLQATMEEMHASQEEMRSMNEELQSTNEELQSTNEELTTSKEELQSLNEELVTVNSELQAKVDDLTRANNDIKNLLYSTNIATVFLDGDLRITRFTPSATNIINLLPTDLGRPISDISTKLKEAGAGDGRIVKESRHVIETLTPVEEMLNTKDDHWYNMRILPYRTVDNVIDGVVITFNDVTELKHLEQLMKANKEYAEAIVATVREPLVVLDNTMRIVTANKSFYTIFHVMPQDVEGQPLFEIGGGLWNIPELKKQLEDVLPKKKAFEGFKVERDFPGVGRMAIMLNARKIDVGGEKSLILLALQECPV
jgi:two-component system CheB/CheR fusion protein